MSRGDATGHVFLRPLVEAHSGDGDDVQCAVGRPVASAVQTVPDCLAGGGGDRTYTAKCGASGGGCVSGSRHGPRSAGATSSAGQRRTGYPGTACRSAA